LKVRQFLAALPVRDDPLTHFSAKISVTVSKQPDAFEKLCAMTGIMTLRSRFPFAPAQVMVASAPTTWLHTIMTDSQITGFTFPGMIELPG
jgi:hypothetical protein